MRTRVATCAVLVATCLAAAPAHGSDAITVVAVGDIAYQRTGAQGQTARLTTALDPDAVLLAGDIAYGRKVSGRWRATTTNDFKRKFIARRWGKVLSKYRTLAVPGNHEYGPGRRAPGYRYLVTRYHLPKRASGDLWWSRSLKVGTSGRWLVLGLDSEGLSDTSKLERERAFIRSKLAANNGVPTIVMWHRPRFSQGEHGDQTDAGVQMLWDETTSDSDVKLAIWGHDHNFEQQTRRGNGGQDVTTIVTGTGGAELRNCPGQADPTIDTNTVAPGAIGPTGALVCGSASATFRNYGVVSLSLTMSGFSWQYRQVDPILVTGRVIASGTRAL